MNKVYSLLGLAVRSRNLVSGSFATEKAVMFRNMCNFYHVPLFRFGRKEELGHAMGKDMRTSLALTDEGFARTIRKHLEAIEQEDGGSEHGKNEST